MRTLNRKIRYAVMGLGHISQTAMLPAFKQAKGNSELVALISQDNEKLRKLGRKYRVAEEAQFHYSDFPGCLKKARVDALYLAVPNHLHAKYALQALEEGVNVLCEKPLAISTDECDSLVRASEDNDVGFMTAYRLHFERANLEVLRLAHDKHRLGELKNFSSVFTFHVKDPANVRLVETKKGGGPIWDIGIYCINAARSAFRDEPIEVFGFAEKGSDKKFDKTQESVSVNLRFPKGRLASFICSFGADACATFDLIGTKGRVHLEHAYDYQTERELSVYVDDKRMIHRTYRKVDQFAPELIYFSDCILKRKTPEPSVYEGKADVQVIEAILESISLGQPVVLQGKRNKSIIYPRSTQLIQRRAIVGEPRTVNISAPTK